MIVYDNILPDYFYDRLTEIEGKYAIDNIDGNYYRFTYPSHQIAIDFENMFLGVGIPYQCDKMYFSKRTEGMKTVYKQFKDPDYAVLVYFINENYIGGELKCREDRILPKANKAVYFVSGIDIEFEDVLTGTQYLFISFFRRSSIKNTRTII